MICVRILYWFLSMISRQDKFGVELRSFTIRALDQSSTWIFISQLGIVKFVHAAAQMTSTGDLLVFYLDCDCVNDMWSHVDVQYFPFSRFTHILIKFTRNRTS